MKKALIIIALLYGLLFSRYYQQDFLPLEFDSFFTIFPENNMKWSN